jgi:hypothetical protein
MRWFMDSEFAENGSTIKLISIALVSEGGEEYYRALRDGWTPEDCSDWVKANVMPYLPPPDSPLWATRAEVRRDLTLLLLRDGTPEVWADFGAYDWVALCQLFGTMMDLPSGMPMFVRDLRQEVARLGVSTWDLPRRAGIAHNALEDARELRDRWVWLRERERLDQIDHMGEDA